MDAREAVCLSATASGRCFDFTLSKELQYFFAFLKFIQLQLNQSELVICIGEFTAYAFRGEWNLIWPATVDFGYSISVGNAFILIEIPYYDVTID